MNDRKAQHLLEMAREADALERDLLGNPLAVIASGASAESSSHGLRRWWRHAAVAAGVAACLVVGTLAWRQTRHPGTITTIAAIPRHADAPAVDQATMFIALYGGDESSNTASPDCWCLQRWTPEQSAAVIAEMSNQDVIAASMERACVTTPSRVVVIGLSGPREDLPRSDEDARTLAKCLLDGDAATEASAASSGSAAFCLASTVDLRVQRWSSR
jgi:hypothetical protein